MKLIGTLLINVLTLLIVEYILPGFSIADLWTAVVTAIVLGVVNTFLRPVLQLIALPITLVTFGIAAFLINVLMLWVVNLIVPGFEITTFLTAVIASILLSLISGFLNHLAN